MRLKQTKGFTLIELIITVAIISVLIAILVVSLNPAEQLARSRDAKRVADLDAIKTGLNLYLAQATTTINLSGTGTPNDGCLGGAAPTWYVSNANSQATTSALGFGLESTSTGQTVATSSASSANNWMPAIVGATPGGSPLPNLPLDPKGGNDVSTAPGPYFYSYGCRLSNKTYELTARLESTYFRSDINLIGTDGGNSTSTYEAGTDLTIIGNAF